MKTAAIGIMVIGIIPLIVGSMMIVFDDNRRGYWLMGIAVALIYIGFGMWLVVERGV